MTGVCQSKGQGLRDFPTSKRHHAQRHAQPRSVPELEAVLGRQFGIVTGGEDGVGVPFLKARARYQLATLCSSTPFQLMNLSMAGRSMSTITSFS